MPGFLRRSMAIRRQVLASDGALGVSLIAKPLRGTFWTLSAWRDQDALGSFVGTSPHRERMREMRPRLRAAIFRTWTVEAPALPPRWAEALRLLAADGERAARHGGASGGRAAGSV